MNSPNHEFFDILGSVLLRCWIFGFVFLFIWLGAFMTGAIHKLHGPLMGLSDHDLNVIHYCGMAILKLVVILFFFIPWLSIWMVL